MIGQSTGARRRSLVDPGLPEWSGRVSSSDRGKMDSMATYRMCPIIAYNREKFIWLFEKRKHYFIIHS